MGSGWSGGMPFQPARKRTPSLCPRQRFVVAGAEGLPDCGRPFADEMLPSKKADMTITVMSAFLHLSVIAVFAAGWHTH